MSFDPVSAVFDLVRTGLDKFVRDKMSEKDKEELSQNMEMFIAKEARSESSAFRDFVVSYEGAAADVPRIIVILRALIRPAFTILVGWLDYLFFTGATTTWAPEAIAMLKAINIIVLAFWFGERALKNSGLIGLLANKKKE
jgi:hypothetical protein